MKKSRILAFLMAVVMICNLTFVANAEEKTATSEVEYVTNSKGITVPKALLCDDPDCLEKHVGVRLTPEEAVAASGTQGVQSVQLSRQARIVQNAYVGMKLSGGNASVLFHGTFGTAGTFSYTINDGSFAGSTGTALCLDHGAANPGEGAAVQCTWEATCTAISGNIATWSLVITPPGAWDGYSYVNGYPSGYQRVGTTFSAAFEIPNGYVKVKKTSANPDLTNGNDCYSLDGAVYTIYSDAACTAGVATMTTNSSGDSNTVTLRSGTYYVKETTAPKGFALDKTVHTVTITSGQTTTINVSDKAQSDPVGILLGKIDKETNQNKPQGSASLAGAKFEVNYYAVQMDTDPAKSGYGPLRTWMLQTDEDGYCYYDDAYKISGHALYYNSTGYASLPLGTITIQEKEAPEGYLVNEEVYVRQIKANGTSEWVETYNQPEIPEQSLNLDVVKTLKGTSTAIPGVVFTHTKPDGSTEDLTTDANGKVSFKGLTYGIHTIEEKSVPDGYTKNPGKVTFTVVENNDLTVNSNTSTDATGKMTFSVQSNGCGLLTVEDVLQPYNLKLHKVNESGKVLEGAEFTIYSDAGCTKAIETKATASDGIVTFSNLVVGTKYYIKETKAPQGYRIPQENGNAHVYEIYTNSDPLSNLFEYYVDGKKHTETSGNYAISGTKADRVVNLTVVNYTGIQLPDTGTPTTLVVMICGMGCVMAALLGTGKKRWKKEMGENE